jgi:hypothetical protein
MASSLICTLGTYCDVAGFWNGKIAVIHVAFKDAESLVSSLQFEKQTHAIHLITHYLSWASTYFIRHYFHYLIPLRIALYFCDWSVNFLEYRMYVWSSAFRDEIWTHVNFRSDLWIFTSWILDNNCFCCH